MRNYWTCSKFADWVRGTNKLGAATAEEWEEWHTTAKMRHNFRYWLAEEGLDYIQRFIMWPIDKLYAAKYFINNRFITHTHALRAHPRDIAPGEWRDVGNRFLPCLFNELVDFVEVELAWSHLVWSDQEKRDQYNAPWWRFGWWNVRLWRCPQAGLDNLAWQSSLKYDDEWMEKDHPKYGQPTPQAENAREILALYTWWTQEYRFRVDPMEASGWSAYCDECREINGPSVLALMKNVPDDLKAKGDAAREVMHQMEADYEREDEEMMIRLIKVRSALWT